MKWCPDCRNMLFAIDEDTVDGKKTAVLSCRKCSYKEPVKADNPLIYEHVLREDKTTRLAINEYLKHDPTLDHLSNIVCPNADCSSRLGTVQPDVVYVKLDKTNLIMLYQCVNCETTWKQASRAS